MKVVPEGRGTGDLRTPSGAIWIPREDAGANPVPTFFPRSAGPRGKTLRIAYFVVHSIESGATPAWAGVQNRNGAGRWGSIESGCGEQRPWRS